MEKENKFYESHSDYLKKKRGNETNYIYMLRIKSEGGTHLCSGCMVEDKGQFFPKFTPNVAPDKNLDFRIDTKEENTIDMYLLDVKSGNKISLDKNFDKENHHQPKNNSRFYYKQGTYNQNEFQLAIGSSMDVAEFYNITEKMIMENWHKSEDFFEER